MSWLPRMVRNKAFQIGVLANIVGGVVLLFLGKVWPTQVSSPGSDDVQVPVEQYVDKGNHKPLAKNEPDGLSLWEDYPYRVLGQSTAADDLRKLVALLGQSLPFSPSEPRSRGLCFRDRGIDLVFDGFGLEKLISYSGHPDEHHHQESGLHPFRIPFNLPRAAVREFVGKKLSSTPKNAVALSGEFDTWDVVSADFQLAFQLAIHYSGEYPDRVTLIRKSIQRTTAHFAG